MNKIIGGLLVVSLLSNPSIINLDLRAYEILNKDNRIVFIIKRDEDHETSGKKIDNLLAQVEDNTRKVTGLLKEKQKTISKIETVMDLRSYAKTRLNEDQMNTFSGFVQYCTGETSVLKETLSRIDNKKELRQVKKQLLHTDMDYEFVCAELEEITNYQLDAMRSLTNIIEEGNGVLSIL